MWKKLYRSKNSRKTDKTRAAASTAPVEAAAIPVKAEAHPAPPAVETAEKSVIAELSPAAVEPSEAETAPVTTDVPPSVETATDAGKSESAAELLKAGIAEGAAFAQAMDSASPPYKIAADMTVEDQADAASGLAYIRLSGGKAKADAGGVPGGYAIRLPDEIERAASGQKVSVSVVARAANTATSKFAVSYSTNEVGNSGWRLQTAGSDWGVFTLEYSVPPMKRGNGDFLGLLAGIDGGAPTDFCYIALHIL